MVNSFGEKVIFDSIIRTDSITHEGLVRALYKMSDIGIELPVISLAKDGCIAEIEEGFKMAFLFGRELSRKEIMQRVGDISQIGGVKKYTLNGGKAEGVTAFEINTGAGLKFNVLPERAMDIAWADYKGTPLSWISKTGVTAPQFFEHKGLEWLRGFYGGVLTTCGLRQTGAPSTCDGEDFALHGRIANTPADNVSVNEHWQGDDFIMTVSGQMRESIVFGENLLLKREITTKLGDNKFVIKDTLINEGFKTEGVLVLYHMNFGFPLVDDGATIQMPKCEIIPATEVAKNGIQAARELHAPVNNYEEQCFFMDFKGENEIEVGINNDKLDGFKGVYIKYNKKQLPWFTIWKMLGESEYVVGLEPGTAFPMGREQAKNEGYLTMLKPFEEYSIEIEVGIKE